VIGGQVLDLKRPEGGANVKTRLLVVIGAVLIGVCGTLGVPAMSSAAEWTTADDQCAGPATTEGPFENMELATLTPQLGRYFGIGKGVLVVRAPRGLQLEEGDVILAIDGRQANSAPHVVQMIAAYQPGQRVSMKIMRQHQPLEVEGTLPERQAVLVPWVSGAGQGDHKPRMTPH
jgi:hypothetical protein